MSESERTSTSDSGVDKALETGPSRYRFPISLKRDLGVWGLLQSQEPAILTVLESSIHITKSSGDSFSASGPVQIPLRNVTVEPSTRDDTEVKLIESSKKGHSKSRDLLTITFWCQAISRAKVLAAIFRAKAKKKWTARRKSILDGVGYRQWDILEVKRSTGKAVNRSFQFIPGTVDIYAEDKSNTEFTSVYSIADIDSILYSTSEEEATVIFAVGRTYRVWRGSHVWAFLIAILERARDKLSKDFVISQSESQVILKRRHDIDFAHYAGTDNIDVLEYICCIKATKVSKKGIEKDKPVVLLVGHDFFIEKFLGKPNVVRVFSPEDIIRTKLDIEKIGDLELETIRFELCDGRIRKYTSKDANCLLSSLYFILKSRGISRFDVRISVSHDFIDEEEKKLFIDREASFRSGEESKLISEQIPALSHDVDTNVHSLRLFLDQVIHTLRAGNQQSLATCYIKVREVHVALERFNHLVPLGKYRNRSGRALLGLFPLIEEINLRIKSLKLQGEISSFKSSDRLDYNTLITSVGAPILETLARSLSDPTNFEHALRKTKVSRIALDLIVCEDESVSLGAIHVLWALSNPPNASFHDKKVNLKSHFQHFSTEGEPVLEALSMHAKSYNFYSASEIMEILNQWQIRFEEYNITLSEKLKESFRTFWFDFYLLSKTKSPTLALKATNLLENACIGKGAIPWFQRVNKETARSKNSQLEHINTRHVGKNPLVASLVRATGGFLWHFLFALNTKMAREYVSELHEYGYKIPDSFRKDQESASCSVLNAVIQSDPRTVHLLKRILPPEIILRSAIQLTDDTQCSEQIDIKKCIVLLKEDSYQPELIWDQRTRLLLIQSIAKQLDEINQKSWFRRRFKDVETESLETGKKQSPEFWNDFYFRIDYSNVLKEELPLGNGLFARPMFDQNSCPEWSLRNPDTSFLTAFLVYTSSDSAQMKQNALIAVKNILVKHQNDLGEMTSFVSAFISILFGSGRRTWRERALIVEILSIFSREEHNMRSLTSFDVISGFAKFLGLSCSEESRITNEDEKNKFSLTMSQKVLHEDVMDITDNPAPDFYLSRIACTSILKLFFSMSTFSTKDDAAIQWIHSMATQGKNRHGIIERPTIIQNELIQEKNFCYISQALLSLNDTIYQNTLLVLHRIVLFVNLELLSSSGIAIFLLSRKSNSHLETSSWLLSRLLDIDDGILNEILPRQMISLLKKKGPKTFSLVFSTETWKPELIWSQYERNILIETLGKEVDLFLKEREKDNLAIYKNFNMKSGRKIQVLYPTLYNRLICGGLYADIIVEEQFAEYSKIDDPLSVVHDSLLLLQEETKLDETKTLLNIIWKMARRFGNLVTTKHIVTIGLKTFINMLLDHLELYKGKDFDLLECIYFLLVVTELFQNAAISRREEHEIPDKSSNNEDRTLDDCFTIFSEEMTENVKEKWGEENGTFIEANSELPIFDINEIKTLGKAADTILRFHASYLSKTKSKKALFSPTQRKVQSTSKILATRNSRQRQFSRDTGKIIESVNIILNILNHSLLLSSTYGAEDLFGAVDCCLLILWTFREPINGHEDSNRTLHTASSCFGFLDFVGRMEHASLTQYAFRKGIILCLLRICLSYGNLSPKNCEMARIQIESRSKTIAEDSDSATIHFWLARNAAQILIRLSNMGDMYISQGLSKMLGDLSHVLRTENVGVSFLRQNLSNEDLKHSSSFLEALHSDSSLPTLIWNAETRHELALFCDKVGNEFGRRESESSFLESKNFSDVSSFSYACHRREIMVNNVFLRIYNKSIEWEHPHNTSFLFNLFSELKRTANPDKEGRILISSDAETSHRAEVILDSISSALKRQSGWVEPVFEYTSIETLFVVINRGIGSIKLKALESIKLASHKAVDEKIFSQRKFVCEIYHLAFASIERNLKQESLSLLNHLSTISTDFAAQILKIGVLVSYLNVIADCAPVKTKIRSLAVDGICILRNNGDLGFEVKKKLLKILPEKLMLIISGHDGDIKERYKLKLQSTDPIVYFDSFFDEPDLLWNESMRQELSYALSKASKDILRNVAMNSNSDFDKDGSFSVQYSTMKTNAVFRGIIINSSLKKVTWSFPIPRSEYASSLIDFVFVSNQLNSSTECSSMLLVASFVLKHKEVSSSHVLLKRFDVLAILAATSLHCSESIQGCLTSMFKIFKSQSSNQKLDLSETFWSCMLRILQCYKHYPSIFALALRLCAAVCAATKYSSSKAMMEVNAIDILFSLLMQSNDALNRNTLYDSYDSNDSFADQEGEFRLLCYLVGFIWTYQSNAIEQFEELIDLNLLDIAIHTFKDSISEEFCDITVDQEEIFNLVKVDAFLLPTEISPDKIVRNEKSQAVENTLIKSIARRKKDAAIEINETSVFYISQI